MKFKKEELIKSPLNYVGGKYKLLPQILPLFPDNIDMFIDLFGGGFNVGINVKANKIIYNDLCWQVVELLSTMKLTSLEDQLNIIKLYIDKYNLSKENQEGFLKLRSHYNKNHLPILLYTLICYSFNNQIRFNSKGEYNIPFGKREYNKSLQNKLKLFVNELHKKNIYLFSKDFRELKINFLKENDFIYCFDKNTEVLTSNGWKFFKDVDINKDLFLSREPNTKRLQYLKGTHYISYRYNGKMYKYLGRQLDLCITEDHNIFGAKTINNKNKKEFLMKAKDFANCKNNNYFIKAGGIWEGNNLDKIKIEDEYFDSVLFARLLGIFFNRWMCK